MRGALVILAATAACGRIGFAPVGTDVDPDASPFGTIPDTPIVPCSATTTPLFTHPNDTSAIGLAWNGAELALTYDDAVDPDATYVRSVQLDGQVGPAQLLGGYAVGGASAVWDGASWRFTWSGEDIPNGNPDTEVLRSVGVGTPINVTNNSDSDSAPLLTHLGGGATLYTFTRFSTQRDLFVTALAADGSVLFEDVLIASNLGSPIYYVSIWTGSEIAVFHTPGPTNTDIRLTRLSPTGAEIAGPTPIVPEPIGLGMAAALAGDRFVLAWSAGSLIQVQYFTLDGSPIGSPVASTTSTVFPSGLRVAAGASVDRVVWDGTLGYDLRIERATGAISERDHGDVDDLVIAWMSSGWAIVTELGGVFTLELTCE